MSPWRHLGDSIGNHYQVEGLGKGVLNTEGRPVVCTLTGGGRRGGQGKESSLEFLISTSTISLHTELLEQAQPSSGRKDKHGWQWWPPGGGEGLL